MVPNNLYLLIHDLCRPLPWGMTSWLPSKEQKMAVERHHFWGQIRMRLWLLTWAPSLACLSGGRLSYWGRTLCRSPCDKGLRALPLTCPMSLEMDPNSIPVFRWDSSSCSQTDRHLPKDPELKAPSWAIPPIPDHRNYYKVTDIYCLKPLDYEVVSFFYNRQWSGEKAFQVEVDKISAKAPGQECARGISGIGWGGYCRVGKG